MCKIFSSFIFFFYLQTTIAQVNKNKDVQLIKVARQASNNAMAKIDMDALSTHFMDNIIVISGNGASMMGKDTVAAKLKKQLEQSTDINFSLNPVSILIGDKGDLAFETGKWVGAKKVIPKEKIISGNYSAMWMKREGIWKLRSELFVSLNNY